VSIHKKGKVASYQLDGLRTKKAVASWLDWK